MAANTYGLSTLTFGAPTLTGFVVQSNAVSSKNGVVVSVADENGIIVHRRYDDVTSEVNFEAVFAGGTIPTPGTTFTVDTVEYIAETVDVKRENKGNKTVTIKGITSQGITLS